VLIHFRYQFTACYIELLLQNGLESPHLLLNEFIYKMTNRVPKEEGLPIEPLLSDEIEAAVRSISHGKEAAFTRLLRQFKEGKYLNFLLG
jgi:hypothetical protein